jgi:glycosyltransferase involved in cell wall biosynthesis
VDARYQVRWALKLIGKGDRKVAAVFGSSAAACHQAVLHVSRGAPGLPIWLYSTADLPPATISLCERVQVGHGALRLLLRAHRDLWPHWVALGVTAWTGDHGRWPVKLAPFTFPPFRALILNECGDFFGGSPGTIAEHACRRTRETTVSAWHRLEDLWRLLTYHVWRTAPVRRVGDVFFARCLLVAATLLGWFGYPHRRAFSRLEGRVRLDIPLVPSQSAGIAPFTPDPSGWNPDKFIRVARSGSARWLLWKEDGGAVPAGDLLPLFADHHTFAVSIQEHYRGWKPGIIPTAPFRALQPDEFCRVLAPLSRTILVDREKLAALEIPRCSLPGTMWLLVFWKAAAAGWVSYSVGQTGPVSPEPDFPLPETGFAFHLLTRPSMRRLLPAGSDLARGSICQSRCVAAIPAPRPAGSRPKVLVVSPFLPYPLSHGGAVRIYNLCRALSSTVDFALAAIREHKERVDYNKLHEVFQQVYVVDLDERPSPDTTLPEHVRHYQSRSLRALIDMICREWNPGLLQIEYTQMAAFRTAAPYTPALLVEHDVTLSLYRQLAETDRTPESQREYERWCSFEGQWLRNFEGVWNVSDDDRALAIAEGCPANRAFVIPNGVDTARFRPCETPAAALEIFYVGSFRHLPNVLGFDKLRREIMPLVWERFPEARLRVVAGPDHEAFWRRFARNGTGALHDRRISVHGFVEDLRPLYASATVVVAPLEVSAGTNIKVLEAMACGKAVVSTRVGCAGLGLRHRADALISDLPGFAGAVCELLASPGLRSSLGTEARHAIEQRFAWDAIAAEAYRSYQAIASVHQSSSTSETAWRGSLNTSETVPPTLAPQCGESSISS